MRFFMFLNNVFYFTLRFKLVSDIFLGQEKSLTLDITFDDDSIFFQSPFLTHI